MSLSRFALLVLALASVSQSTQVYVMMPLDTITNDGKVKDAAQLEAWFSQLSGNADGIMIDVWFGIVQRGSDPTFYDFDGYRQVFGLAQKHNLKVQAVNSFHRCGGNVGDACDIPLPQFVIDTARSEGLFYKDQHGHVDEECLSLSADHQRVFPVAGDKLTALDLYRNFFAKFKSAMSDFIASGTLVEVQISLGPAGELRYPSYQSAGGIWTFPGIGEFQCYDKFMLDDLAQRAKDAGNPEWGHPPTNAGDYNSYPYNTDFFSDWKPDNYASDYGKFFLSWYTDRLVQHGSDVLAVAKDVYGDSVDVSAKIAGIHWWYKTSSHAAECTAGYENTNGINGYDKFAQMFKSHGVAFDFTCLEMRDTEQNPAYDCGPQELVKQTQEDAKKYGVTYSGENALPRYDQTAYDEIIAVARNGLYRFTYLRLCDTLMSGDNWNRFRSFCSVMRSVGKQSA